MKSSYIFYRYHAPRTAGGTGRRRIENTRDREVTTRTTSVGGERRPHRQRSGRRRPHGEVHERRRA
jgi:hypothetical protein